MPEVSVVLLGPGFVGKSTLSVQYVQGHFLEVYDATIEEKYRKAIEVDGSPVVLTVVDTAGQDAFGSCRDAYMKAGDSFLLCYSIVDENSFGEMKKVFDQLQRIRGPAIAAGKVPCTIVGNKLDMEAARQVPREVGEQYARSVGASFIEVSARDRPAVQAIFELMVRVVLRGGPAPAPAPTPPPSKADDSTTRLPPPPPPPPPAKEKKQKPPKKEKDGICTML